MKNVLSYLMMLFPAHDAITIYLKLYLRIDVGVNCSILPLQHRGNAAYICKPTHE